MRTIEEAQTELKEVKSKINSCNTRINNTINFKTERKINSEKELLVGRKIEIEKELEELGEGIWWTLKT